MKSGVLAALLIATVVACHSDRTYTSAPSTLVLDANHNGNAFFFWLPPLLNQQAPTTQVLSRQLAPVVTITNLCTAAIIRTFAGADVQPEDSDFHVNWPTGDDNLDPSCAYRLTAQVGTTVLGLTDVDVVDGGNEFQNVSTGDLIPLLSDRTLPIRFFIGVGATCVRAESDCGEGTALPGQSITIITTHKQAGVSIPAGAVDQPVTITVESSDDRPCIAGLAEPVFSGDVGPIGNSCYDIHADPPLADVNASGKFNTNVTVGICAATGGLDHATRDLLQIFQLHVGADPPIRALNNVPAAFLQCDPAYPVLGMRRDFLGNLVARLGSFFLPRPLSARTTTLFDMGAGGSTDGFSRFSWALPRQIDINFDQAPDVGALASGAIVDSAYRRLGVTFSRSNLLGLCPGTAVYANDDGPLGPNVGQNNVSVCPLGVESDFSENLHGTIAAHFVIRAVEACITATPRGYRGLFPPPGGVAFIEALDSTGAVAGRTESTADPVPQELCVRATGISGVRFAGKDSAYATFDNLRWIRVLPTQ